MLINFQAAFLRKNDESYLHSTDRYEYNLVFRIWLEWEKSLGLSSKTRYKLKKIGALKLQFGKKYKKM